MMTPEMVLQNGHSWRPIHGASIRKALGNSRYLNNAYICLFVFLQLKCCYLITGSFQFSNTTNGILEGMDFDVARYSRTTIYRTSGVGSPFKVGDSKEGTWRTEYQLLKFSHTIFCRVNETIRPNQIFIYYKEYKYIFCVQVKRYNILM